MYTYTNTHTYKYIYVYTYVYIHIYIYIYTYMLNIHMTVPYMCVNIHMTVPYILHIWYNQWLFCGKRPATYHKRAIDCTIYEVQIHDVEMRGNTLHRDKS